MSYKIALIGQGNVAWHLTRGLATLNDVVNVNSRTLEGLPKDADLYLISISDDAIVSVVERLPKVPGIVAHTSGSMPLSALTLYTNRPGVWYPLQTFTKGSLLDYKRIPVFIEASNSNDLCLLENVAKSFSDSVYTADSDRRRRLHVASVFACNYVNHLWKITGDILSADNMPLEIMLPLIEAATEKIHHLSPRSAQTGPASRGDTKIIESHIEWLKQNMPDLADIYRDLALRIMSSTENLKPKP